MEKITANHPLSKSADIIKQNVDILKSLFPTIVKEGKIDVEELKALLGEEIESSEEYYRFTWAGKSQARQEANKPSTGTLRPVKEESKDWNTTKNIFIEGDNLEVLKLLQKSYSGKIKMIYIDPPYNTGKDFVYKDNYADNLGNYLAITRQTDEEGKKLSTNTESDGRYHSNWLNMMYPRLKLARNLLKEDGIIFISIDDDEMHNLKKVCNEIFGEENFVASLVYDKNRKNDAKYFSVGHEYMLVYFKNSKWIKELEIIYRAPKEGIAEVKLEFNRLKEQFNNDWELVAEGLKKLYASWDDEDERKPLSRFSKVDEKGPFRDDGNISWPGGGGPKYEVIHPITKKACKIPDAGWRFPKPQRMQEEIDKGRVVFGPDESTLPRIRRNLFEADSEVMRSVNFSYAQTATVEFNKIFENKRVFENPKHFEDLKALVAYVTSKEDNDIILDFFAGSGSTGHSVMKLNAEDGGSRKFICVQLPEPTDPDSEANMAGYKTIAEITKERLRRAGEKVKTGIQDDLFSTNNIQLDIGFRVFKLDSSNINAWDGNVKYFEQNLLSAIENIKPDRTEEDVLYEILLKSGLDLVQPIEEKKIAGKKVFNIGVGALFICLANDLTTAVAEGIGKWKQELEPATCRVIFKDTGFNDVEKTNSIQILKRYGINEVNTI